jgi:hypothetical protein
MAHRHCTPDIETLDRLCRLTNRKAFAVYGIRSSCIFTSAALRDILEHLGIDAELMRVEALGFGKKGPVILGSDGDGTRRPASAPGMWKGHLTVIADGRFLLDPTLDQIDGCKPFTGEITDMWLRGEQTLWWVDGVRANGFPAQKAESATRYHAFPGRGGWKSAPDFRSANRRRPVVEAVLTTWKG